MVEMDEQKKYLLELANTRMPFGKYKDWYLVNIPDTYYVWFKNKGFPNTSFGKKLASMYEIKLNGLEDLVRPLIRK